jgi:hypothetical protein
MHTPRITISSRITRHGDQAPQGGATAPAHDLRAAGALMTLAAPPRARLAAELRRRMEDMRFRKEPDCFRSGRGEPSLFVFGVGEAGGVGIGADAGFGGVLWVDMVRGKC